MEFIVILLHRDFVSALGLFNTVNCNLAADVAIFDWNLLDQLRARL